MWIQMWRVSVVMAEEATKFTFATVWNFPLDQEATFFCSICKLLYFKIGLAEIYEPSEGISKTFLWQTRQKWDKEKENCVQKREHCFLKIIYQCVTWYGSKHTHTNTHLSPFKPAHLDLVFIWVAWSYIFLWQNQKDHCFLFRIHICVYIYRCRRCFRSLCCRFLPVCPFGALCMRDLVVFLSRCSVFNISFFYSCCSIFAFEI